MNRRNVSGVVRGPDARPLAGVVVRWGLQRDSNPLPQTTTDTNGEFRLDAVPDEDNVLSVMKKGFAPAFPAVQAGGHREVEVELQAGATVRGRVVDDTGVSIEGVGVSPSITNPGLNRRGFVYLHDMETRTDREGRFVLEGMPEGVKCDFVAEGRSAVRQRLLSPVDESKNEVVLLGDGAIRGRVVDSMGRPVRNFLVRLGIPKDAKAGEPVGGFSASYGSSGLSFTRDDGEFTITRLTAGHLHLLTVTADGLGSGEAGRVEATTIGRLKPAADLTIKLDPGQPGP